MSFWKRERPCLTAVFSSVHRKHFHFRNPQLTVKTAGEYLIVTSDAYARSVEIKNEEDRLLLEDNYFDMQPGTRKIRVLSGNTEGLKIRSVYDIR